MAGAVGDGAVHGRDTGIRVLHSADRGPRAASRRRTFRAREGGPSPAGTRCERRQCARPSRYEHQLMHDVLAFSARRLDRLVLAVAEDLSAPAAKRGTTRGTG